MFKYSLFCRTSNLEYLSLNLPSLCSYHFTPDNFLSILKYCLLLNNTYFYLSSLKLIIVSILFNTSHSINFIHSFVWLFVISSSICLQNSHQIQLFCCILMQLSITACSSIPATLHGKYTFFFNLMKLSCIRIFSNNCWFYIYSTA